MPISISKQQHTQLIKQLNSDAIALGFSDCKITDAQGETNWSERLQEALAKGHHGSMDWLADSAARRASPDAMWPEAKSAIMLAMNYGPQYNPLEDLKTADNGVISVYARHRDYHELIKGKLKTLASKFLAQAKRFGQEGEVKVFVDTAPLLEKPLAGRAGLGWQGKHTNLVSRELGSWFFIGSILTNIHLHSDAAEEDHCGSCRSCLDICPTNAFPAPYKLDARKCISYLTIEHDGPIEPQLRDLMGNRIYGCDDCLAICPWNKFAKATQEIKLQAREDLQKPKLAELVQLDDTNFRTLFSGSPIKRIGRDRFIRNVLIAIGNSGDKSFIEALKELLNDQASQVRGAAIWALGKLCDQAQIYAIFEEYSSNEAQREVLDEWKMALGNESEQ